MACKQLLLSAAGSMHFKNCHPGQLQSGLPVFQYEWYVLMDHQCAGQPITMNYNVKFMQLLLHLYLWQTVQQLTTEAGVGYLVGCVNLNYTIFPSLLYTGGALPGMLPQRR
jgi:hypothetical protein